MNRKEKCLYAIEKGFTYNSDTGIISNKSGVSITKKVNEYICIILNKDGNRYYLYGHHFAWYVVNKKIVPMLDHKNRIKNDNRIKNLEVTTKQLNALNNGSSGATYDKRRNKWISYLSIGKKVKQFGGFDTKKEAEIVSEIEKTKAINNIKSDLKWKSQENI